MFFHCTHNTGSYRSECLHSFRLMRLAMLSRGAPLTLRCTPATSLGLLSRRVHAHCTTTHMSGGGGVGGGRRGALGALGVPRMLHMALCLRSGAPGANGRPTAAHALAAGEEASSEPTLAWPFQWEAWETFLHQCVAAGCFLEYEGVVMARNDLRAAYGLVPELGDASAHKRGVLEFARKYGYLLECVPRHPSHSLFRPPAPCGER
jgi:hypothetical protein